MKNKSSIFGRNLTVTLLIPGAASLKDKRQVIQSLLTKLRQKFNISVIEAGFQEQWQRAQIGIAFIAGRFQLLDFIQQEIIKFIEDEYLVEIIEMTVNDF